MVQYRELQIEEIDRIGEIERKEEIRSYYKLTDGKLTVVECIEYVHSFDKNELSDILFRQRKLTHEGGMVIGAFDGERIVGVASIENKRRGSKLDYCKMDILYVGCHHRGLGVGKRLVNETKEVARTFGASKLYISATPTKNTIDFYLKLGAVLTLELDRELYDKEPDDIHLELNAG